MRILLLPMHVANQIAAGEVIERPSSVVKELLENALDAGATQLHVDIGFGGLNQITVSDNGHGILRDDLPLAVAAHATSKLRTLDDLSSINTMGFRGEALASIAAVSRLSIQSRHQLEPHGTRLSFEGEQMLLLPCARTLGTTVDIRDLFYNAPVRKKFLKTEALEYFAIESVVKRFALSEPGVAITLTHNGKKRLALPQALNKQAEQLRFRQLLGKAFMDHAIAIHAQRDDLMLHGWVSGLGYARSQQDKQWMYLNRRMVRDPLMLHAMKQAYAPLLPPGRHAACLLYLTINMDTVDVNVHPTKHEVRFHQPRAVHDFIRASITDVLSEPIISKKSTPAFVLKDIILESPKPLTWTTINRRMVILNDKDTPYLVDMLRFRQHLLLMQLKDKQEPWERRPLLVPIEITIASRADHIMALYKDALFALGLAMEIAGPYALRVLSIARDFPALDLQRFVKHIGLGQVTCAQLLEVLISSDDWDLLSITQEEKEHWMTHWQEMRLFSCCLDEARCEALLHA